jgi:tetratricopeptide (TPR) repeat protein
MVGFLSGGMLVFLGVVYMLGINPTTSTWSDLWHERGLAGLAILTFPSILGGVFGGLAGAELAWRMFLGQTSTDCGWADLERSKELWQLNPDLAPAEWYGCVNPRAASFRDSSAVSKAKASLQNALDHAPASNRDVRQANINEAVAVRELGLLHRAVNEFEQARKAYNSSLKILRELGGIRSESSATLSAYRETVFRIAELAHALQDYDQAVQNYQESLRVDEVLHHDDPAGEEFTRNLLERAAGRR